MPDPNHLYTSSTDTLIPGATDNNVQLNSFSNATPPPGAGQGQLGPAAGIGGNGPAGGTSGDIIRQNPYGAPPAQPNKPAQALASVAGNIGGGMMAQANAGLQHTFDAIFGQTQHIMSTPQLTPGAPNIAQVPGGLPPLGVPGQQVAMSDRRAKTSLTPAQQDLIAFMNTLRGSRW